MNRAVISDRFSASSSRGATWHARNFARASTRKPAFLIQVKHGRRQFLPDRDSVPDRDIDAAPGGIRARRRHAVA
jgi:hypothetical protein